MSCLHGTSQDSVGVGMCLAVVGDAARCAFLRCITDHIKRTL